MPSQFKRAVHHFCCLQKAIMFFGIKTVFNNGRLIYKPSEPSATEGSPKQYKRSAQKYNQ